MTLLPITPEVAVAAFKIEGQQTYGIQFHPGDALVRGQATAAQFRGENICWCARRPGRLTTIVRPTACKNTIGPNDQELILD
jgi:GMP synthase (glutamine-hydrolysing)